MKIHNLIQNTQDWHAHRLAYRNASVSPAIMGKSAYVSRAQVMREIYTGISEPVSPATQALFDEGHRIEKLALPLAEKIVGRPLLPLVGTNGDYGASFDGITEDHKIVFEHKTLNDSIRACKRVADLPLMYRIQMEHQLMVCDGEKCLFMATEWDDDGLRDKRQFKYEPDLKLRAEIVAAWDQFMLDLKSYTPPEVIPAAVAAPTLALPAVSIKVDGALTLITNLDRFLIEAKAFVSRIPKKLITDQDFVNGKDACKRLKDAQDALDAAEANAIGQVASFDEMKRTKALCVEVVRTARLATEKLVASEEKTRKEEIVMAGKQAFADHVARLNARLGSPLMPPIANDFPGAIKGLSKLDSMREKVNNELVRIKLESNAVADKIQGNLAALLAASDYDFLFSDKAQLVLKDADAVTAIIKSRITEHKAAEEKRLEAEREKIRAEEQAKAKREAEEAARLQREADAKIKADEAARQIAAAQQAPVTERLGPALSEPSLAPAVAAAPKPSVKLSTKGSRPSDADIITALALHYRVHESKVIEWLLDVDLRAASERMAREFV